MKFLDGKIIDAIWKDVKRYRQTGSSVDIFNFQMLICVDKF